MWEVQVIVRFNPSSRDLCASSLSFAQFQPQPGCTSLAPVPSPPSIFAHSSCHSSYHSLKLTAPFSPFLLYLSFLASSSFSYLSPWFIRGSVQFTHIPLLTPLSPPLLQLDSHICARSFIFVILGWGEEEGVWERWDNRRSVVFAEEARLSFHILHRLLSALIGVLSEYVCVCVCVSVNECVDWLPASISCVKVSRPGGSSPTWKAQ